MSTQATCNGLTANVYSSDYGKFAKYIKYNVGFIPYRLVYALLKDGELTTLHPELLRVFVTALQCEEGVSFS